MHVDDFIDDPYGNKYARWVLMHFRLRASLSCSFSQFMKDKNIFCKYEDRVYKVIGASRMGDIWLCKDFEAVNGYDLRVDIDNCSDWSDNFGDAVSEPKKKEKKDNNVGLGAIYNNINHNHRGKYTIPTSRKSQKRKANKK